MLAKSKVQFDLMRDLLALCRPAASHSWV